jgi:LCP family protein required for cell wall assembly
MSDITRTWNSMPTNRRALAVGGLAVPLLVVTAIVAVVLGSASFSNGPAASDAPIAALPTDAPTATPAPTPQPTSAPPGITPAPTPPGPDPLLGVDGRLTVLLMGSDSRPSHPGHRTDAIMVVSMDPSTGESAAFSVPRDTQNFPLPDKGTYRAKVNAMYGHLQATTGRGAAGMKQAMSRAFGIEVDHYVLIGFSGVQKLVRAVGGVDVTLDKAYYDAHYWVNGHTQGWGLPKGTSHLGPADALIFARSRKGDNDFGRARRQQILVMAAVDKVLKRGVDDLPALLKVASETVRTDLPVERAADMFATFGTIDLDGAKRVVFGPRTYASSIGGSAFALKLDACRDWIKRNFPPERPFAAWPVAGVTPAGG